MNECQKASSNKDSDVRPFLFQSVFRMSLEERESHLHHRDPENERKLLGSTGECLFEIGSRDEEPIPELQSKE